MEPQFRFAEWQNEGQTVRGSLLLCNQGQSPWVIFCHGYTGHRIGPGFLFVKISKALTNLGISSLRFDFRGSGESDGTFHEQTLPVMFSDLVSATLYVTSNFKPASLILAGHSFGGLVSAIGASALKTDGLVLLSPVADLNKRVAELNWLAQRGPNSQGLYEYGPHEISPTFVEKLTGFDPKKSVCSFKGPLLVVHGEKDEIIPFQESQMYMDWAQNCGLDATLHPIPGADHNYTSVPFVKETIQVVCSWLKEHFE